MGENPSLQTVETVLQRKESSVKVSLVGHLLYIPILTLIMESSDSSDHPDPDLEHRWAQIFGTLIALATLSIPLLASVPKPDLSPPVPPPHSQTLPP